MSLLVLQHEFVIKKIITKFRPWGQNHNIYKDLK